MERSSETLEGPQSAAMFLEVFQAASLSYNRILSLFITKSAPCLWQSIPLARKKKPASTYFSSHLNFPIEV
jgi:hypothetical protein